MKPFKILQVIIGAIILVIVYSLNLPWIAGVIFWFVGFILILLGLSSIIKKDKKCPKCGWDRPKDANECSHCGFRFVD